MSWPASSLERRAVRRCGSSRGRGLAGRGAPAARQRQLGALLMHERGGRARAPDLELLEALGKQIGTGLENVRLYAELRASSSARRGAEPDHLGR